MVKRKRDAEASTTSQTAVGASALEPDVAGPATKKTRANPARASRSKTSQSVMSEPKPAPAKKPRAPRTKKAAATTQSDPASASASSSTMPLAGPSQPAASSSVPAPSKKGRGKKKADPNEDNGASGSQPEKRGAVFKPKCPQNIMDRVHRVMTQRYFEIFFNF